MMMINDGYEIAYALDDFFFFGVLRRTYGLAPGSTFAKRRSIWH